MIENYFHRQIQLWGEETQDLLREKAVLIVGCGGLGSSVAFALSGVGLGKIYVTDFDDVSVTNIHRQIAFRIGDEGRKKSEVVAELIKSREDGVEVKAFTKSFIDLTQEIDFIPDLIIDATDNFDARHTINDYAKENNIPWIYGSVEEFHGQYAFFDKSSFKSFNTPPHKPGGIAAPIVMSIAAREANLALRYLAGLEVKKDLLYYVSYKEGEETIQKFKLPVD